jgi:predicted RNA binding protein YcfA (HicA-like mRNA interferase family)
VKQVSGKEFMRIAAARGWTLNRIAGSHFIWTKPGRRERLVVPVHGNRPLKIGTLKALMKIIEVEKIDL